MKEKIEPKCSNTACRHFVSDKKCKMFKKIEWCGYKHYRTEIKE